jgi:hypothetical protein
MHDMIPSSSALFVEVSSEKLPLTFTHVYCCAEAHVDDN